MEKGNQHILDFEQALIECVKDESPETRRILTGYFDSFKDSRSMKLLRMRCGANCNFNQEVLKLKTIAALFAISPSRASEIRNKAVRMAYHPARFHMIRHLEPIARWSEKWQRRRPGTDSDNNPPALPLP